MRRPASRLIPALAIVTVLSAGLLVAAWTTCLAVATSQASVPDSPANLGVTYLEMTAQAAEHHPECVQGALVTAVRSGGAADLAGLQPGDTIVGMDGQPLSGEWTLVQSLLAGQASRLTILSVRRGDLTITVPVTLTAGLRN